MLKEQNILDFYTFTHFTKYSDLLHAVSTKSNLYPHSFSLAMHTGEVKKNIISNRRTLEKYLKTDRKLHFIVANQTHSDNISIITTHDTQGWESQENAIKDCDALITNCSHVMLTILTADCVPILLYDPEQKVIAAVHAGWKGTKAQIVRKTVKKMSQVFHSNPADIYVGIGPAIGKCCYEVGKDVAKYFFDYKDSYTKHTDKYMLDLANINKKQLLSVGVQKKNIEMSNICTACDFERFFSYRKEDGCSGRFMSMIGLH